MVNYKNILLSLAIFLGSIDVAVIGAIPTLPIKKVKIFNNAEQSLRVAHDVPEYTQAIVEMSRLPEPQRLLHEAILNNSTNDILQAINVGADVNLDIDGKLPILIAMSAKKLNAIEVLKKCGAIVPVLKNIMYRAILNDSSEAIRYAVNAGAKPGEALSIAISFARYEAIEALLGCGAESSIGAALQSMKMGDIKSALLLLKMVSVNIHTARELKEWRYYQQDIFRYMVTEIDPMWIKDIFLDFLQALIDHGYDINTTSFHTSAWASALKSPYFSIELLELLMRNGANPNQLIEDSSHGTFTPLLIAIQENNIKAAEYLIGAGAAINKPTNLVYNGHNTPTLHTPLFYARTIGKWVDNHDMITLLVKHGARG